MRLKNRNTIRKWIYTCSYWHRSMKISSPTSWYGYSIVYILAFNHMVSNLASVYKRSRYGYGTDMEKANLLNHYRVFLVHFSDRINKCVINCDIFVDFKKISYYRIASAYFNFILSRIRLIIKFLIYSHKYISQWNYIHKHI